MERCGKINASNSGADSWTGIGVVAGFCTVVLIMQWPHRRKGEVTWRSELLQRLQDVRGNCKTRNQLHGLSSTHPLYGVELRALRQVARDYPDTPYVFVTERKGPFTDSTFRKIVARAGAAARLGFPVHPHMLRHATGFKLANDGHDTRAIQHYLGHKNIQYTVRYTELSAQRFTAFWPD